MCGIVGMSLQRGDTYRRSMARSLRESFTNMLVAAQDRGSAATGVVLISREDDNSKPKAFVLRAPLPAKEFVQTEDYKKLISHLNGDALSIIGHTRAVSGNNAGAEDNRNNHPHFAGRIVGIHNGRILNDDKLWERYSAYITPRGRCDSEIIFSLLNRKLTVGNGIETEAAIIATLREIEGWYALALVDLENPGKVYLARDEDQPLVLANYTYPNVRCFASEKEYIHAAVNQEKGILSFYDFEKYTLITLDAEAPGTNTDLYVNRRTIPRTLTKVQRNRMIANNKKDYNTTQGL